MRFLSLPGHVSVNFCMVCGLVLPGNRSKPLCSVCVEEVQES